jgi:hypothetical protein
MQKNYAEQYPENVTCFVDFTPNTYTVALSGGVSVFRYSQQLAKCFQVVRELKQSRRAEESRNQSMGHYALKETLNRRHFY